jgi:hypothetical protein
MWWSVFVKAQGEDPGGGVVTTGRLEALPSACSPHHGVVGGGRGAYDAQLSLEGDDLAGVVTAALDVFAEREDFPPPMVQLAAGPVWLTDSIRAFERSWDRRPGRRARAG